MDSICINLMRRGGGNQVYVSVRCGNSEFSVFGDSIYVNIDELLPDPTKPGGQLTISHNRHPESQCNTA